MFHLRQRTIGENQPVFLIAEAGVNHNGDVTTAHKLIDAAADAGADAVKFQTFTAEELVSPSAPLAGHHIANVKGDLTHFELIKKIELPRDAHFELKAHCEKRDVVFISTPYDISSGDFLAKMEVEIIKIASSEMTNYPLLDVIRQSKIPIILSTGMNSWDEIVETVNFIREAHNLVCILKCTSNYPASPESINLRGIFKLKEAFPENAVGFSDHTEGVEISLTALGMGVSIIERHFTLDKNAWGPDHRASLTPEEFRYFVKAVRKSERSLGTRDWDIQAEELAQRATMQKGVYARRNIKKGEKVTLSDVKFLRPLGQMSLKDFFLHYLNRPALVNIESNQIITPFCFKR
jgi:sialic acid synthase SpsE